MKHEGRPGTSESDWIAYLCLQVTRQGQASYAHVHEIINGLRSEGLDVRLYQPDFSEEAECPPLRRVVRFMRTQLRLFASRPRPVQIYCRAHLLAFPTAIWAYLNKIPIIQEVNSPDTDMYAAWPVMLPFRRALSAITRWQYRKADAVITVTNALASWTTSWSGQRAVYVVENGANISIFRPEAALQDIGLGKYVVFFGALAPWQGLDSLIQATESTDWPQGIRLVVIGDGSCKELLVEASTQNSSIVYLGRQPYEKVAEYAASATASIIPKSDSGDRNATGLSPLKLYESVASGVPVVVTDIAGQSDFVRRHDCGLVVPPGDPEAIAIAVARLASDPDLRDRLARNAAAVADIVSWGERARDTYRVMQTIGPLPRRLDRPENESTS